MHRHEQAQGTAVRATIECGCWRRLGVRGSVVLAVNPLSGANVGTKPQSLFDNAKKAHDSSADEEMGLSRLLGFSWPQGLWAALGE